MANLLSEANASLRHGAQEQGELGKPAGRACFLGSGKLAIELKWH